MKTFSKNAVCFFLAFSFCAFISGCSSNPSPGDGQQAVQARINQDAQGRITLNSFRKTNGQLAEVNAVKLYGLEFEAEIEFTADCKWITGIGGSEMGFRTAQLPNKSLSVLAQWAADDPMPGAIVKQGQRVKLDGVIRFEKKENGWFVDAIEINRSTPLSADSTGDKLADGKEQKASSINQSTAPQTDGDQYHVQQTDGVKESAEIVKAKAKAEKGDAQAQCYLGFSYDGGKGVTQDYVEAAKWFRKAAEQGFAAAQANLGIYYDSGKGVQKDYVEAAKWFRKAAEQGFAQSQYNLGYYYVVGQGVTQSNLEAYIWFSLAADQGIKEAASARDSVASLLSQKEKTDGIVEANRRNLAIIIKRTQGSISDSPTSEKQ